MKPLFILAPPRSFTSVTCGMIGQHPEMYGLPEINLFISENFRGLQRHYKMFRPRLGHGLLRAMSELALGSQSEANVATVGQWLAKNAEIGTDEIFEDLANWAAPRRLVDKSPIYVYEKATMERIHAACPDAYYLHLVRHPRSNCHSVVRINKDIGDRESNARAQGHRAKSGSARFITPERLKPENIWLNPHLRISEFLETVPDSRQMFIRGEDLLSDSDKHLGEIAAWLGIRSDAEALDCMKHPETSPYACYGPRNARIGNDPGFLEDAKLRPYKAKHIPLDGPLEWDPDSSLSPEVIELANIFGYE